jgi:hypothetical protein
MPCAHRQGAVAPETAIEAFDHFLEKSGAKYDQACEILKKDHDVLLTFNDFPASHWRHLRTTNPIESTFATIRLRHRRAEFSGTGGNGAWQASLNMMFKPAQSAAKHWHKLNTPELILSLVEGNAFTDAVPQLTHAASSSFLRTQLLTIPRSITLHVSSDPSRAVILGFLLEYKSLPVLARA